MCHLPRDAAFSSVAPAVAVKPGPTLEFAYAKKSPRFSPFRRMAKTARVNLNKYWGLLSQQKQRKASTSSSVMSMDFDFSAELEQNRINELLEAQANAEEQNSINSQIEVESSPEQPRRLFVRQQPLTSPSFSSCSSSCCQSCMEFDSISQDSVFF